MSDSNKLPVYKHGKNFEVWKTVMKRHFMMDDFEEQIFSGEIVISAKARSVKREGNVLRDDEKKKALQSESKMVMTLLKQLDENIAAQLMSTERFSEMWQLLCSIIEGDLASRKIVARREMKRLKYFEPMSKFLEEFRSRLSLWKNAGGEESQTDTVNFLFDLLPQKFDVLKLMLRKAAIDNNEGKFVLKDVISYLELSSVDMVDGKRNRSSNKDKKNSANKNENGKKRSGFKG